MNILTYLRAALAAKEEVVVGEATFDAQYRPLPRKNAALKEHRHDRLHALLTADTIRALLDVAEAAIALNAAMHDPDVYAVDDEFGALDAALAPLVKEV